MTGTPSSSVSHHEETMCVLGCGTMGIAILGGVLKSLDEKNSPKPFQAPSQEDLTQLAEPPRLPGRFVACVGGNESAKRVKSELWKFSSSVQVTVRDNVASVRNSDLVLLACKPPVAREILAAPGMAEALAGKILVSICAGVTEAQLESYLSEGLGGPEPGCRVVRAMPNTASLIREGMTVVATTTPPLKPDEQALISWIFSKIGRVVFLPPKHMDAVTALCGSGPAFCALVLEALADGGVAMGLPRAEAQKMAAQSMRGASSLVLTGEHPAILRDKVTTPAGCTIGGLIAMEDGGVRAAVSKAVRDAAAIASRLGGGQKPG